MKQNHKNLTFQFSYFYFNQSNRISSQENNHINLTENVGEMTKSFDLLCNMMGSRLSAKRFKQSCLELVINVASGIRTEQQGDTMSAGCWATV